MNSFLPCFSSLINSCTSSFFVLRESNEFFYNTSNDVENIKSESLIMKMTV